MNLGLVGSRQGMRADGEAGGRHVSLPQVTRSACGKSVSHGG